MKRLFNTFLLVGVVLVIISASRGFQKKERSVVLQQRQDIIACGSLSADVLADAKGKFISLLPGLGHLTYPVTTGNDSTQLYFDQGLNFYYSYHFREALASFKEAARFDTTCAMAYWGQALSMGPYYNAYYYKMRKEIPAVVSTMQLHAAAANGKEQELVRAMQRRYSTDMTNQDRVQLDSSYAAALSLLAKKYPADNQIKTLYVDAVMLQHKWDFWNNDGLPKKWTPELVGICESVLKDNPRHPAALHYYIHLVEASRHPELALSSADILKDELPGAGHMVHMATHMYQRNGLFSKGVSVNEEANAVYNRVDLAAPGLQIGQNAVIHFYAVQSYCAMNAGMYSKGIPIYMRARNRTVELRKDIQTDLNAQDVYMMPVIAWVRLGKWDEILRSTSPDTNWKYASVLDDFAKGMANIHFKNIKAARKQLIHLEQNLGDSLMGIREMPFNKPVQSGRIAAGILEASILFEEGKGTASVNRLREAIKEEDALTYREPQDWRIPARQYLGAILLKMKRPAEAEKVYREDLVANPGNGWSLTGMYNSMRAQHKNKTALLFKARYTKAFESADVVPVSSVF